MQPLLVLFLSAEGQSSMLCRQLAKKHYSNQEMYPPKIPSTPPNKMLDVPCSSLQPQLTPQPATLTFFWYICVLLNYTFVKEQSVPSANSSWFWTKNIAQKWHIKIVHIHQADNPLSKIQRISHFTQNYSYRPRNATTKWQFWMC